MRTIIQMVLIIGGLCISSACATNPGRSSGEPPVPEPSAAVAIDRPDVRPSVVGDVDEVEEEEATGCQAGDTAACLDQCREQSQCSGKDECNEMVASIALCSADGPTLGTLCRLPVSAMRPTQGAVGGVAVACRAEKLEGKDTRSGKKLARYLLERPVPAIVGLQQRLYITDRHHLSTGLLQASLQEDRKQAFVCPLADLSESPPAEFWDYMETNHLAWLRDRRGEAIAPSQLPTQLSELTDDPYRTLSRWVRNSCGYIKCDTKCGGDGENTDQLQVCKADPTPPFFLEFKWADYLRQEVSIDGVYSAEGRRQVDLLEPQLTPAIAASRRPEAEQRGLPGWNGDLIEPQRIALDDEGCEP